MGINRRLDVLVPIG